MVINPNANFWSELARPAFVLAPMAGVTDAAFRRIIAKYGKPDVMWTEFTSADGLISPGRRSLLPDLWFDESERPIVAQLHSGKPEKMRAAAALVSELGFDGIDINMGCPSAEVEKHCSGAALMKHPALARELIQAAKDGAQGLPVSVKTRIGYSEDELDAWLPVLLEAEPAAITLHARTRDEMSRVPARWSAVARAVCIARQIQPDDTLRPLILGNGDAESLAHARAKADITGCDGVMIGRGIFGNPWLFNRSMERSELTQAEILTVMLEHTRLFLELFSGMRRPFDAMKKHYKAYCGGFDGAPAVRAKLMAAKDYAEVVKIVEEVLAQHGDKLPRQS
jgi:nifR3 family TIM-barrel protein